MKLFLIHLQIDTADNSFHHLSIMAKFRIIERCVHDCRGAISAIPKGQPFKAMLVAPEYFFARSCPERDGSSGGRHYDYDDYMEIRRHLTALSKKYPQVLFVPGTVAWKKPIVDGTLNAPVRSAYGSSVPSYASRPFNKKSSYDAHMREIGDIDTIGRPTCSFASYMTQAPDAHLFERVLPCLRSAFGELHGGDSSSPKGKMKILQERILTIGLDPENLIRNIESAIPDLSFAYNTALFYLGGRKVAEYHKHSDYQEAFQRLALSNETAIAVNDNDASIVNIGGVKIGVEICLDHNCNVLQTYISSHGKTPDIHLILSATVANNPLIARIQHTVHSSSYWANTRLPVGMKNIMISGVPTYIGTVDIVPSMISDFDPVLAGLSYGGSSAGAGGAGSIATLSHSHGTFFPPTGTWLPVDSASSLLPSSKVSGGSGSTTASTAMFSASAGFLPPPRHLLDRPMPELTRRGGRSSGDYEEASARAADYALQRNRPPR